MASIAEALNFRPYCLKILSGDRKTTLAATRDNLHDWYILSLYRLSSTTGALLAKRDERRISQEARDERFLRNARCALLGI